MTTQLKRGTGELVGEPPVHERRALCPKCDKRVRIYTAYHVDFFVDHRDAGDNWTWCAGGGMRVSEVDGKDDEE
jgi:hypothetical protein